MGISLTGRSTVNHNSDTRSEPFNSDWYNRAQESLENNQSNPRFVRFDHLCYPVENYVDVQTEYDNQTLTLANFHYPT